jgi:hypothetical protein
MRGLGYSSPASSRAIFDDGAVIVKTSQGLILRGRDGAATFMIAPGATWGDVYASHSEGNAVGEGSSQTGIRLLRYHDGASGNLGTPQETLTAFAVSPGGDLGGYHRWSHNAATVRAAALVGGTLLDLGMLAPTGAGWTLEVARGINDRGVIVGNGFLNGEQRAFLLVPQAETSLAIAPATGVFGSVARVEGVLQGEGQPVAGKTLTFRVNGTPVGSAVTDSAGRAVIADVPVAGIAAGDYPSGLEVSFDGDLYNLPASGQGSLRIDSAPTTLTIQAPTGGVFGEPLTMSATLAANVPHPAEGIVTFVVDGSSVGSFDLAVQPVFTGTTALGNLAVGSIGSNRPAFLNGGLCKKNNFFAIGGCQ